MSQNLDLNDPRITAYALGEMKGAERAEFEVLLKKHPEAQNVIKEIRLTESLLSDQFAKEPAPKLADHQRQKIMVHAANQGKVIQFPRQRIFMSVGLSAIAAYVLVMLGLHFLSDHEKEKRSQIALSDSELAEEAVPKTQAEPDDRFRSKEESSLKLSDSKKEGIGRDRMESVSAFSAPAATPPAEAESLRQNAEPAPSQTSTFALQEKQESKNKEVVGSRVGNLRSSPAAEASLARSSDAPAASVVADMDSSRKDLSATTANEGSVMAGGAKASTASVAEGKIQPETAKPKVAAKRSSLGVMDEVRPQPASPALAKTAEINQKADEPEESISDAYQTLLKAEAFNVGPIGDAKQISSVEKSLQRIAQDSQAVALLKKAFAEGGIVTKMYALLGLKKLDTIGYLALSGEMRRSNPAVSRMKGNKIVPEPAASILDEIDAMSESDSQKH